jgi:hypothetical protein
LKTAGDDEKESNTGCKVLHRKSFLTSIPHITKKNKKIDHRVQNICEGWNKPLQS